MATRLERLARHHGLTLEYDDPATGAPRPVPQSTLELILDGLGVDPDGRPNGTGAPRRITVPDTARCWLPPGLHDAPAWGISCQLYEVRSSRNWGIGDFADLAELARICGEAGADFLGVNPLHALFLSAPERRSPFSPSNRRFLNPLYIAVDKVPGAEAPSGLDDLRALDRVDYCSVRKVKMSALRDAFEREPFPRPGDRDAFGTFAIAGGTALRLHAVFEAISHQLEAEGYSAGWRCWPEVLQDPASPEVQRLSEDLALEIEFHTWLQWVARRQLSEAARAARDAGMRIGLYLDLAVGEAPDGSSTWSGAAAALPGLSVGAPPDVFATVGQNWGLAAPSPASLRAADFAPFRDMIEAQLSDAGALRIDHAMALWQLFLIPEGEVAAHGTHLRQPFADLVGILADLSHEHEALIIGEDLGFVPNGFREAMREANILSYRILYFEQTARGFKGLSGYPEGALACLSTHDLPIMSAWWRGRDIELRESHGLVDPDASKQHAAHRAWERRAMIRALRRAKALSGRASAEAEDLPDAVLDAAHRFVACTPSLLAGVRLADLVGPEEPTNLPGTDDTYPNWQLRSPVDLADIPSHPVFRRITALMCEERPRPGAGR